MGDLTMIRQLCLSSKQIKDLTQQTQKRGAVLLKLLYTALVRGTYIAIVIIGVLYIIIWHR